MSLICRAFNSMDGVDFYRWFHDKRLNHYFRGYVHGCSPEQAEQAPVFMRAFIHVGEFAEHKVGLVSLADTDKILRIFRLGLLVDPAYANEGHGKNLMAYGLDWAFKTMMAHKVYAEALESDDRVIRGLEAAKFQFEGCKRSSSYLDGVLQNEVVYSMLRPEYFDLYGGSNDEFE